jgi:hypothetical protein
MQRAIQEPNSQARLVIDVFRHRNWESGSVDRDVQLRALNVTHCRCPGTELDEGGTLRYEAQRRSHPYIRLRPVGPQMGEGFAALDAAPSH